MNKVKVYHQCGHNDVWNFDIFNNDNIGDGMIFAPKMAKAKKIKTFDSNINKVSFFDPQFYFPRSRIKKFEEFDFFPNIISDGYSTVSYEELCYESANKCVEFQIEQDYKFIVIPTVVYDETPQEYLNILRSLYIEPFISEINKQNINNKKVLITVVVKDIQILDENFINDMLNLITGYDEIDGVYLVPSFKGGKRLKDIDYIFNLLRVINILKENDLYVHLAYIDIEGIIFTLANIDSVSIGTYENVRRFNLDNFKERDDETSFRTPNKRIYSNKLYQWIDINYIGALKELEDFNILFDENEYVNYDIATDNNWNLKNPEVYKHYLTSLYKQYINLPLTYEERYKFIISELRNAITINNTIEEEGILLDNNSNGDHLSKWYTAINRYNKYLRGE